jgi:thiol-disulfide isomerase/thioredoxin
MGTDDMKAKRAHVGMTAVMALLVFVSGCIGASTTPGEIDEMTRGKGGDVDWKDAELVNVLTGEAFRISDFEGRTVLLESFAVWCPTCLSQQKEMRVFTALYSDDVVHISLDTDPNEDETRVIEHATRNELDWIFAVSPIEVTRGLIDEFGIGVVNAPSAPVILICEDQSTRLLRSGVKSAQDLRAEIETGC